MEIKKIILNSARNDNKSGVLSITVENKKSQLNIKGFNIDLDDKYILLLKNENNKYEVQLTNTVNLIPEIDLAKKISCLIIKQEGGKSFPVLWGGTSRDEQQDVQASMLQDENDIEDECKINSESDVNEEEITGNFVNNEDGDKSNLNSESDGNEKSINKNIDTNNAMRIVDNPNLDIVDEATRTFEKDKINVEKENVIIKTKMFGEMYIHTKKNENETNEKPINNEKLVNLFEIDNEQIKEEIKKNIVNIDAKVEVGDIDLQNDEKAQEAKIALSNLSKIQGALKENNAQYLPFGETDKSPETSFYNLVKNQYEDMFAKYEGYKYLSEVIPNSKWIKVDCDNDYYVLGLIYEEDEPKFMCYGIPQALRKNPPIELREFGQWLPLDMDNPDGAGFYIMYQSAQTGENIKVEVI